MVSFIKQTRARFFSTSQEEIQEDSSMEDKKIPPQKTQSFREKRTSQSWIRRQFARQMSWDYDFSGAHYPTAVAAAAYAVKSLEESRANDQKMESYAPEKSSNKMKSKVEDPGIQPERRRSSAKITDEFSKASFKDQDVKLPISTSTGKTKPESGIDITPYMKKQASFVDKDMKDERTSSKSKNPAVDKVTGRTSSSKSPPTFADTNLNITTESQTPEIRTPRPAAKPGPGDSVADAWEKEEMASVKERYEKMMDTIEKWETKKATNAKRKIERREAETYKRRMKTVQSYSNDISRIQEVAKAAKAQAEKNCRNEEIKVKEKADKIRKTGKIPATCLCF